MNDEIRMTKNFPLVFRHSGFVIRIRHEPCAFWRAGVHTRRSSARRPPRSAAEDSRPPKKRVNQAGSALFVIDSDFGFRHSSFIRASGFVILSDFGFRHSDFKKKDPRQSARVYRMRIKIAPYVADPASSGVAFCRTVPPSASVAAAASLPVLRFSTRRTALPTRSRR